MVDSLTLSSIIQHEGFSATPYWDRNAYRIGYGSDTWTDGNGRVHKVTKDTAPVSQEDAYRDLTRRVPEFQREGVIKYVGEQAWNQLAPETKAAVTSLAYNYGSLSELPSLRKAIQSAQPGEIAAAIKARATDNGGINRNRRLKEAAMVAPLAPVVPGPPNRTNALQAINDAVPAMAPASPATAYAPQNGSLSPTVSAWANNIASTPRATTAVQPGTARPAISGTAQPMRSGTALPPPTPQSIVAEDLTVDPTLPRPNPGSGITGSQLSEWVQNRNAPKPGLTTRSVQTVPIDPTTGSVATGTALASGSTQAGKAALQSALDRIARQRAAAQSGPPVTMDIRVINKGRDPSTYATIQPTKTPGLTVAQDLPLSAAVGYEGKKPGNSAFGDYPGTWLNPNRLQPGNQQSNQMLLGALAASAPKPPSMPTQAPAVQMAGTPPLPVRRPMNAPQMAAAPMIAKPNAAPQTLGYAGLPASELPAGIKPNNTDAILQALSSPQVQMLGKVNSGQKPILNAIMRMFVGGPQPQAQNGREAVAAAMSGLDPRNHNPAQIDALSSGRSWYSDESGAMQPVRAMNGNIRYTY